MTFPLETELYYAPLLPTYGTTNRGLSRDHEVTPCPHCKDATEEDSKAGQHIDISRKFFWVCDLVLDEATRRTI